MPTQLPPRRPEGPFSRYLEDDDTKFQTDFPKDPDQGEPVPRGTNILIIATITVFPLAFLALAWWFFT